MEIKINDESQGVKNAYELKTMGGKNVFVVNREVIHFHYLLKERSLKGGSNKTDWKNGNDEKLCELKQSDCQLIW